MKLKMLAFAIALLPVAGYSAEIASVNFGAIKDDLRAYYPRRENEKIAIVV